jgi:hypothetical protein
MPERTEFIKRLCQAYRDKNLTLYLGAGVSVANGIPSWEKLVLAMYFAAIEKQPAGTRLRPFPNYLFAIAEWHLNRRREPLDITARKIRNLHRDDQFLEELQHTLYAGFYQEENQPAVLDAWGLVNANATLKSVVQLCFPQNNQEKKIRAVITYNYDCLLEVALANQPIQPIWRSDQVVAPDTLPIYHVHGYVPANGKGSTAAEIIFTEEQYHLAAHDAYAWSNLVQLQHMTSSVGLMIGLSMTDRNMRRLLDAIRRTPIRAENYVLLQEPKWQQPGENDIEQIDAQATKYWERFAHSGMKSNAKKFEQIKEIIHQVERRDLEQETAVLTELGVCPVWYKDHSEIPELVQQIMARE